MNNLQVQIQTMYSYSSHTNIPWNIGQYKPVKQYLDPEKIKQDGQKKVRNYKRIQNPHQPKGSDKIFFIDELIKPNKQNPSPDKYKTISLFVQNQNRKKSKSIKINPRSLKYSYLDWIQIQGKKRKHPSVGKYNLTKTEKQLKQQLKLFSARKFTIEQKRHFFDGAETTTLQIPGAGNYNPHLSIQLPPKPSRKDRLFWIDKHKKQSVQQRKKNHKKMAPNSYRPISASFNSFDKIELDFDRLKKKNKEIKTNSKLGFTTSDSKFEYTRQNKIKNKQKRPHSSTYNTLIVWKGKNQTVKGNWTRCLSAGPQRSIYH